VEGNAGLRTFFKEIVHRFLQGHPVANIILGHGKAQDQLLTKEGALEIRRVSNATFLRAINEGIIKPQLVKGRTKTMYLEPEVRKIEKK